jgi:hypothetical protein
VGAIPPWAGALQILDNPSSWPDLQWPICAYLLAQIFALKSQDASE